MTTREHVGTGAPARPGRASSAGLTVVTQQKSCVKPGLSPHRSFNILSLRKVLRFLVPRIGMANNPHAWIRRKHPLDTLRHSLRSVGNGDLSSVKRISNPYSTAIVHGNPGRSRCRV